MLSADRPVRALDDEMSEHFCTYFDHRYAAKGLAMWRSLKQHCATATLHVLCLNDACYEILAALRLDDVHLHSLSALEAFDQELLQARGNRSLIEYYFTLTPCLPLYLLKTQPDVARLTYVDADLLFFADPQPVFDEIGDNAVGLIEHRFSADLVDHEVYGHFNVGWLTFSNDPIALECLQSWREQCLAWCHDRLEGGRFAEQKYLDQWPDRFPRVRIVQHRGANVAPWNLNRFKLALRGDELRVGGQDLLFYHAHGFEPQSPGQPRQLNLKDYNVEESPLLLTSVFEPYERALISAIGEIAVPWALAMASDRSRETLVLVDTLKSKVTHLDDQLTAADADRAMKTDIISTLQAELAESTAARAAAQSTIEALQAQLSATDVGHDARTDANYRLLEQLAASEGDRAEKANTLAALRTQWSETEVDRVAKTGIIQLLQAQLVASDNDRAAKADALQALHAQLAAIDADRATKTNALEALQAQLVASEGDRAEKAQALFALHAKWSETEVDRVAKAGFIEVLQLQLATSESDRAAKAESVQTLQTQLAVSESDRTAKAAALIAVQTQLGTIDAERAAKAEAVETLQTQLAVSESDRARMADAFERVQAQLAASEADRSAKSAAIETLEAQLTAIRQSLAATQASLAETQAHLGALQGSRSWRWTNRFRSVLDGLARMVRSA